MELLSLVCLFVLAWSARTLGDETGPDVIKIYVKEDDDIILPCSIRPEIITDKGFDWKRDGKDVYLYDGQPAGQDGQAKVRISPFPDQIKTGNASIKIINAKVADSGNYTCYIPSPPPAVFPPQSQIELTVAGH
ncbi:V-set domain-containing T-cell activation inhibitor 1-like [Odontesthes bonariensis]